LGKVLEKSGKKEQAKKNYEKALENALKMLKRYPGSIDKTIIHEIKADVFRIK